MLEDNQRHLENYPLHHATVCLYKIAYTADTQYFYVAIILSVSKLFISTSISHNLFSGYFKESPIMNSLSDC